MKNRVLEYLNGLITENTIKSELDIIEYCKKSVREYVPKEKVRIKKSEFVPPTLDEISSYIKAKGYSVDASKFYEYYTTAEWHDKNGKAIKNWKLKLLIWNEPRQYNNSSSQGKNASAHSYSEEEYDNMFDDINSVEV